jgi:ketosteroid isomerase-like protein
MAGTVGRRFMAALQKAERTRDVGPLIELFDDAGETLNLGRTRPVQGREGLWRFWEDYLATFREVRSEFTHVVEGDGGTVLAWRSRGALRNGEPVESRGVSVLETDGERVRKFRTYYDSAVFLPEGAKTVTRSSG